MSNTTHSLLLLALLGGCTLTMSAGSGEPPTAPPSGPGSGVDPDTSTLTGVVELDDAIQNATVYFDDNGNNMLDAGEASTTTDATGHYTFSWSSANGLFTRTVGAIITADSIRVGTGSPVGFAVHLRAPLEISYDEVHETAVISPLTTLVVSEMDWNQSYDPTDMAAPLVAALKASTVPFSNQPLDLMADYVAASATSADAAQLRVIASGIAATIADAVATANAAQSHIDCNNAMVFTPAIVAMDDQLTVIASSVYKFEHLTAAQQADIQANPGNYQNFFLGTADLATTIENELESEAQTAAAAAFAQVQQEIVTELAEGLSRMVAGELLAEIVS